jgi:WD40 repeat protein
MRILKGHTKTVYSIKITPDGNQLVSVSLDDWIRLWDLARGTVLWEHRVYPTQGNLAMSGDGKLIASASHWTGSVFVWQVETGKRVHEFGPVREGFLSFRADNMALGCASYLNFNLWHLKSGKEITPTSYRHACISSATFSPDGKYFVGGAYQRVNLWSCEPDKPETLVGAFVGLYSVPRYLGFSPDSRMLVGISQKRICVWEVASGQILWQNELPDRHYKSAAFSPNSEILATAGNDSTVRFYNTSTWQLSTEFTWKIGQVVDVLFAPDGLTAIASGRNGKIIVWDVDL